MPICWGMGSTNLLSSATDKIAKLRGELETKRAELEQIEAGVKRLTKLHREIAELQARIDAGIRFVGPDHPNWRPDKIKPVKAREWKTPFKPGEVGRTALAVLREHGGWLRPSGVAAIMLEQVGHDRDDRTMRARVSDSIRAYFKKYDGDLVESTREYGQKWRVIRHTGYFVERVN